MAALVTESAYVSRSKPDVLVVRTRQHVHLALDVMLPIVRVFDQHFDRGYPSPLYESVTRALRVKLVKGDAIAVFGGDAWLPEIQVMRIQRNPHVTKHLLGPLAHYPVPLFDYEEDFWAEMLFSRLRDTVTTEAAADLSNVLSKVSPRMVIKVLAALRDVMLSSASLEKIAAAFPQLPQDIHAHVRTA